jgi:hypothetical protein
MHTQPSLRRFIFIGVGAVIVGLLVVGVVLTSRLVGSSVSRPSPSRDAAVVHYREMVLADVTRIDVEYSRGWTCKTRAKCISATADVRTATEALLTDVAAFPAPTSLNAAAQQMKAAAEQFVVQLDAAAALMQQPSSDFIAAAAAPNVHDVDFAAATIGCWPLKAVEIGRRGIDCS